MSSTATSHDFVKMIQAAWIAPMDSKPMRDGAVVIQNRRILAAGNAKTLRRNFPDAQLTDLGQAILLPGLVNAHVHLELTHLTPGDRPVDFVAWIERLMGQPPHDPVDSIDRGIRQSHRFGVTSVGDITTQPGVTRSALAGKIRGVSFGEVRAMAQRRGRLDERIDAAVESSGDGMIRSGISPHAPYSIEMDGYRRCLDIAKSRSLPLATHLAETPDEREFLASHAGRFGDLWATLNAWDDRVPRFAGGPIRMAQAIGLLDYPSLLAHVNDCHDDELKILSAGRASVVYCPRTHAWFDRPPHRWREMLDHGINVAIGTDSTASSANLNLVDDLRLMHRLTPDFPVEALWQMVTMRGAKAMQMESMVGSLSVEKAADLVAFEVRTDRPLEEILEDDALPSAVWLDGRRLTKAGSPPAGPC